MKRNVLSSLFLLFFSITAFAFPEQMSVTASSLNVRSGPSADYEIVFKLTQDEKIEVLGTTENKDWAYFRNSDHPGQTLWVAMAYLSQVAPIESSDPVTKPLSAKTNKRVNSLVSKVKPARETVSVIEFLLENLWMGISVIGLLCLVAGRLMKTTARTRLLEIRSHEEKLDGLSLEERLILIKKDETEIHLNLKKGVDQFESLKRDLAELEEKVEAIRYGLRPPIFRHEDSEDFKDRIREFRHEQFKCIKAGDATLAHSNWDWDGSRAKGNQMVKAYSTLLLNAFNAEFEFIRRTMRVTSGEIAQDKLTRLDEQLTRLGEAVNCEISGEYMKLKSLELYEWYEEMKEKALKKEELKRQQKILREQAKNKALAELDELDDKVKYRRSDLLKAQKIASQLVGLEAQEVADRIDALQKELNDLEEKRAASMSQAQKTRAGFIYVISNIGSLGEGIVKIGMTRRLDPMERVIELGDASVPFRFDVHTLAFTSDAPRIEAELHKKFHHVRVNQENYRKEFFRITPQEVKVALDELGMNPDWYFEVEAREYRESLLIRASKEETAGATPAVHSLLEKYPEAV